jgi:hypothetical protein
MAAGDKQAAGEAMAHVLATFRQFARRLISQRTKEALAVKRASGWRLGYEVAQHFALDEADSNQLGVSEGAYSYKLVAQLLRRVPLVPERERHTRISFADARAIRGVRGDDAAVMR